MFESQVICPKQTSFRFLVQKTGGKSNVDKTDSVRASKLMYYNKWVPSLPGEYRIKGKGL